MCFSPSAPTTGVAARAALQRFARLGLPPWSDVFRGRLTGAQATLADGPGLRKGDEQRHVARIGPDALAGSRGFRPKASIGNGNPGTLRPSASKNRAFTEKKVERLHTGRHRAQQVNRSKTLHLFPTARGNIHAPSHEQSRTRPPPSGRRCRAPADLPEAGGARAPAGGRGGCHVHRWCSCPATQRGHGR